MIVAFIDCKTVGFFLKISKEIGKAWRKSLTREARERACEAREKKRIFSVSPQSRSLFSASFDCSRVLEYAKIRTVLQSIAFISLSYRLHTTVILMKVQTANELPLEFV